MLALQYLLHYVQRLEGTYDDVRVDGLKQNYHVSLADVDLGLTEKNVFHRHLQTNDVGDIVLT